MKVDENTIVVYMVVDERNVVIGEFGTRQAANEFINYRDEHADNTILWAVIPEARNNELYLTEEQLEKLYAQGMSNKKVTLRSNSQISQITQTT